MFIMTIASYWAINWKVQDESKVKAINFINVTRKLTNLIILFKIMATNLIITGDLY